VHLVGLSIEHIHYQDVRDHEHQILFFTLVHIVTSPFSCTVLPLLFKLNNDTPTQRPRNHTLYDIPPNRFEFHVTQTDL
jgi:hypothetical protein